MRYEPLIQRYRSLYAKLLRLYSKPYYERFGEEMEQTFSDLLRECAEEERGLFGCALWVFVETSTGIVRENMTHIIRQNKNIVLIALATAFLLLIPFVAMWFTDEVTWSLADFVFAGALIFGTGLAYELVARRAGTTLYRAAIGVALAAALFLVSTNGAVGLIGSEDNPANLMYIGVLAALIIGALIARLRPLGMARVLFVAAFAQMLVAVVALIAGMHRYPGSSVLEILSVNGFFAVLFIGSALLFQRASATGSESNQQLE